MPANPTIALADDHVLLRKGLADLVSKQGYTVLFQADNGEEFLEKLKTSAEPDIVLLDINMPKKDGREVLKELKQHPKFKKIPVVIFSTTNNEQEMHRCYESGANSYITKPNSFENLLKTVAALRSYWMHVSNTPS